ncbi:E3 ubiquitin-protein ligase RING1-like [Abrus precatorius]|uniref:RING-type E3 ubiquitin transferase n=1 Tax=Abrus precatorius TaxID=3816 RepID=A0A8B8M6Q1_ABRPR|nr:E3 ubiquitin-protein ligase RING1-like [Abrus precatorius]
MFVPTQEFLEDGASCIQMNFSNAFIPNELISSMMPDVISYGKAVIQNCRSDYVFQSPKLRLFTLVLDIFVQCLYDERDNNIINMIMGESVREVHMVPASMTAIETIKKVKLEESSMVDQCSICLIEFDKDMEVSMMPCKHVYHQECLIKWLKTSHTCPLCRYSMPTS